MTWKVLKGKVEISWSKNLLKREVERERGREGEKERGEREGRDIERSGS